VLADDNFFGFIPPGGYFDLTDVNRITQDIGKLHLLDGSEAPFPQFYPHLLHRINTFGKFLKGKDDMFGVIIGNDDRPIIYSLK
jgi:hypothetical protein